MGRICHHRAMADYRPATPEDVAAITETVDQGFATYAAFLPPGWTRPPAQLEGSRVAERLGEPSTWLWVAEADGQVVGHAGFAQARTRDEARAPIRGLAHLFHLFVREPYWGTGIARELHRRAVEEVAARGYEAMRLVTPVGQARARAFYERQGWATDGVAHHEPMLAMDVVEYRRAARMPGRADRPPAHRP
jgi:GNAT superfamily N-acetyltransferase